MISSPAKPPRCHDLIALLAGGDQVWLTVGSDSMSPTIRAGDMVAVRARRSYHRGDVVAFQAAGALVVHRLLGGAFGHFVHAGDGPTTWRGLLRAADIVGRVEAVGPRPPGPPPPVWRQLLLLGRTLRSAIGVRVRQLL